MCVAVVLVGCGGSAGPNTNATATREVELAQLATAQAPTSIVPATATVKVTATPPPTAPASATLTATPKPTNTPAPTNTPRPTATPRPTNTPQPTATATLPPTPTLTAEQDQASYRADLDIREVDKNWEAYDHWKLTYAGQVLTIQADSTSTLVQVQVAYPGGSDFDRVTVIVVFLDPHVGDGIFEDDYVRFWGQPIGPFTFTNALGGQVTQIEFSGSYLEKSD